jgi:hypothetical protein
LTRPQTLLPQARIYLPGSATFETNIAPRRVRDGGAPTIAAATRRPA